MLAKIEEESPKTKEFWKYILEEFLARSPLRKGKVIEIKIEEDMTPLPEFTEIPEPSPLGDTRGVQISAKEERGQKNFNILWKYLQNKLVGMCDSPQADDLKWSPLKATISFIVQNPQKIYREIGKMGITIPEIIEQDVARKSSKPKFYEDPPRIVWDGTATPIPPNSKQLCACRIAFRKSAGEIIHWDEVAEEIDDPTTKQIKIKWRNVYDTVRAVNKKVKSSTGKDLFKISKLSFYRIT